MSLTLLLVKSRDRVINSACQLTSLKHTQKGFMSGDGIAKHVFTLQSIIQEYRYLGIMLEAGVAKVCGSLRERLSARPREYFSSTS